MTWNEPASLRGRRSRRYRWIASGGICAAVRPASNTAAAVSPVLNLSRASPSPALAICTHPGRWRGGAGVQNIREHLRSSAPCQQHSGSGQPGAEPEPRQPVTRFRDLHPSRTLARWRGSAEPLGHLRGSAPGQHHGVSGQPAAEPEPRQPVTRSRDLHPPRTLARWRGSSEHQEESAQQCGRNSARQLT